MCKKNHQLVDQIRFEEQNYYATLVDLEMQKKSHNALVDEFCSILKKRLWEPYTIPDDTSLEETPAK